MWSRAWRERLAGLAELDLPSDRPRPARRSGRGALYQATLAPTARGALEALGRAYGTTPFMTFLSVFVAFLRRLTGQDDVAVGTVLETQVEGSVIRFYGC